MPEPVAVPEFAELAAPLSVRAHMFIASAMNGAKGEYVGGTEVEGELPNGKIELKLGYKAGYPIGTTFPEYLAACFKNRGLDCDVVPIADMGAKVILNDREAEKRAVSLGATFPGSDKYMPGARAPRDGTPTR